MDKEEKTTQEEFKVNGRDLVDKVKELIQEGNVRRIIVKNKDGATLVELPVTVTVIGAVFAPVLAGLGAIAALVTECSIIVERRS
jgi:putative cell wall-binding protein